MVFACAACWVVAGLAGALLLLKAWYQLTTRRCSSRRRMDGKVVVVTGANAGIGKETALELARRGARVVLACRDPQRGAQARDEIARLSGNSSVYTLPLDLGSLASVRSFVAEFSRREARLDVLVNNAAAAGLANKRSADGLQQEMQVNHFGPFLLTVLLVDVLKRSSPSRVVVVSSLAHKFARLQLDNLNCERWFSDRFQYSNAKLANVLFANQLARRLRGTGVTVNSLHPGIVQTSITRRMPPAVRACFDALVGFMFKSAADGAQTSVHLAVSEEVENVSGKYFVDCREAAMSATAQDARLAEQLWTECSRLVGLQPRELDF